MKARISKLWDYLSTSYWLVPFFMIFIAATAAVLLVRLDRSISLEPYEGYFFIFAGGPDSAGRLLATIAGTVITITSIVFSITVVVLTLASNQFGPRLLRNFMGDLATQISLGVFVSTFIFCLLVLSYVRYGSEQADFVPRLAVSISLVLAVATGLVLSFYIHHIAVKIHADTIVFEVSKLLEQQIEKELPESDHPEESFTTDTLNGKYGTYVKIAESGYIEVIDYDSLVDMAAEHDLLIKFNFRAGQFVTCGQTLACILGPKTDDKIIDQVRKAAVLSYHRTPVQDLEFSIGQIVEVAIRALSPSINDSFTAISCVDRLGQGFAKIARRPPMHCRFTDKDLKLRVVKHSPDFGKLMDAGFNQIRQMSASNVAVGCRVLEALANVADNCKYNEYKNTVLMHASLMRNMLIKNVSEDYDRNAVESRFQALTKLIKS